MTRQERLLEDYEDALFSLLMERVILQEGERLEARNRELLSDPAAAVPESLDRRCRKVIRRRFQAEKRRTALRNTGRLLRTAAAAAALLSMLFTTAFAVSEDFRTAALELVRTVTGQYTQLDIRRSGEGRTGDAYFRRVEVGWVPEGFTYSGGEYDAWAEFENKQGQTFRVNVYAEYPYDLDRELQAYSYQGNVYINGNQARCFTREDEVLVETPDGNNGFYYVVRAAGGVSMDTAVEIITNVRRSPNAAYFENAEIGWLPEGFTYQEGRYDWYAKFADGQARWLWVYLYDGTGSLHIDTADAEVAEDVSINGNEGLCVVKNGYVHFVMTDLTHLLYIDVIASDTLSVDEVRKVVENIQTFP